MPSKGNHVCTKCETNLKCVKTGAIVEELMDDGSPYKIWSCDLLQCPSCGVQIAARFADQPIAEHFSKQYPVWAEKAQMRFGARVAACS